MGFNTELLHGTKTGDPHTGATLTPVYQSSAFFQPSAEQHEKLFHNKANGYSYTRINNPTIAAFEERMTVLEKGVASVACASGMAALTNALLNIVGSGQEIIASTSLYGGTIELGADIVINSTSKYINGNSSAISGVLTDGGKFKWNVQQYPGMKDYLKFGKFAFTAKLRNGLFRNMGACMAPQTAFYNLLGMETLGLRMERACDNAAQLAAYLDKIPGITVNYPGLYSSPWYEVAERVLDERYGAILTIRVGSKERAFAIMNQLKIPQIVSNIGDTKTLIVHPESTLAAHSTEAEKRDAAVYDDMIRVSVGIEDIEDLVKDFEAAIADTAEML